MKKLIAIIGMAGSGKGIATDYLEEASWSKIYFGGVTYKLMEEAGIVRTEDGKSEKEFREKHLQKGYFDYRKDGFITGLGSNFFRLAGSVILYGILAAFILVIVKVIMHG